MIFKKINYYQYFHSTNEHVKKCTNPKRLFIDKTVYKIPNRVNASNLFSLSQSMKFLKENINVSCSQFPSKITNLKTPVSFSQHRYQSTNSTLLQITRSFHEFWRILYLPNYKVHGFLIYQFTKRKGLSAIHCKLFFVHSEHREVALSWWCTVRFCQDSKNGMKRTTAIPSVAHLYISI